MGLGFALLALAYTIGCIIGSIVGDSIDSRYMITICFVLMSAGTVAASGIVAQSLTETMIGLGVMSLFLAGISLPCMPEATNSMKPVLMSMPEYSTLTDGEEKEPIMEKEGAGVDGNEGAGEALVRCTNLSDKTAALVNMFFMLGSTVGPVLGGGMYDAVGFCDACLLMAGISFAFSVIYLIVAVCLDSGNRNKT